MLVAPAFALLLAACGGRAPHVAADATASQGRAVDVGGRRLVASVVGRGAPTIVLLSGLGMTRDNWDAAMPALASLGTVVSYDRAGIGSSELGTRPADGVESARDLHVLLERLGRRPPYVLVAHSHGGNVARLFASQYPRDVAGMLLEEVQHERVLEELRAALTGKDLASFDEVLAPGFAAPPQPRTEQDYRAATRAQVQASGPLPDIPLVVLAVRGRARAMGDLFSPAALDRLVEIDEAQMRDLAARVPRGRVEFVTASSHLLHAEQPEVLVGAVREVLAAISARSRRP